MPPRTKRKHRRANGEGSISRRKNGLWIGRLRVGDNPDGTPRTAQVTSMDHAKLVEKLTKLRDEYEETGTVVDRRTTMAQWGEKWLTEIAARKLGPNTYATHASLMRKWIIGTIGNRVVSELTPADIRKVRDHITAAGRSSTTALQAYRVLSSCLEYARREKITSVNITKDVDPPRPAKLPRGAFTVPQVLDIIRAAGKDEALGARWMTQLLLGLRQGEVLGLRWAEVDFDAAEIRVAWQLQVIGWRHDCGARGADGVYPCGYKQAKMCKQHSYQIPDGYEVIVLDPESNVVLTKPKSKAGDRAVPMIAPVARALAEHRERTAGQPNPHGLVWHTPDGRPLDEQTDQAGWKELMRSVGLPDTCTTHWARHSVASLLKQDGVDTLVIGQIVGHGSTAVTEGYIHVTTQDARDAMDKFAARLLAASPE